jgi:cyclopropane fatty-acyl-phospholipid synthase-like methyltransferase
MEEIAVCPGCKRSSFVPYTTVVGKPYLNSSFEGFDLVVGITVNYVRCLFCGMVWQTPRMGMEDLNRWYSEGYYRKWLGQSETALNEDEYGRAVKTYEWVNQYLEPQSLLDFGCSRGFLLDLFDGIRAEGVESNQDYVRTKLPVYPGLESVPYNLPYDAITCIHVLEHLADPLEYIQALSAYLAPGGLLFLEVPSLISKGGPFRLAHLTFMEPAVLVGLCERANLEVINVSVSPDGHTRVVCTDGAV